MQVGLFKKTAQYDFSMEPFVSPCVQLYRAPAAAEQVTLNWLLTCSRRTLRDGAALMYGPWRQPAKAPISAVGVSSYRPRGVPRRGPTETHTSSGGDRALDLRWTRPTVNAQHSITTACSQARQQGECVVLITLYYCSESKSELAHDM